MGNLLSSDVAVESAKGDRIKMPDLPERKGEGRLLKTRWASAEELETVYVNHVFITHNGPEFYLIFAEADVPMALSSEDLEGIDEIWIRPKVKLALTPEAMLSIGDAINRNVSQFREQMEAD